jgi:hypothetical protein
MRATFVDRAPVGRGEQVQLPLAADERRARARERALGDRLLRDELEGAQRLRLAADGEQLRRAEVEVARRLRGPLRHQHLPRLGGLLQARGGVDRVAGRERLARTRLDDRHDRPGVDPHPQLEGHAVALAEHRVELVEPRAHPQRRPERPRRVVLVYARDAERGHDRVPDELLDGAALRLDLDAHGCEERSHDLLEPLRVKPLAEGRRAGDVREQHRDDLQLLGGRGGQLHDRCAAAVAEAGLIGVLASAARADRHAGKPTF